MTGSILVIGATGAVGSRVRAGLERRGEAVVAASRDPSQAAARADGPARWVALDLERPESFAPALVGVDRAFLIARPGDERADVFAAPLIDAMQRAGVRRVVDISAMGVEAQDDAALRKIEVRLERSGLEFVHLRPNFFMQVFCGGPLLPMLRRGEIALPAADAKISYVDAEDIAAVAVAALCEPAHAGRAYTLTGPEALDHHEVAARLAEATGAAMRYTPQGEPATRELLAQAGMPPARVERLIGFYRLVRAGWCAPVSDAVASVLGRPARPFARFARDHARCWT